MLGKILGGGLGWAVGGPIGGILGVAFGSLFDKVKSAKNTPDQRYESTAKGDFGASLIVLSAAVMKADGKVLKSELNFVKQFFQGQFGPEETIQLLGLLKNVLNQSINIAEVCLQIKQNTNYEIRLQLLHYLFGIAKSDGQIDQTEVNTILSIAQYLGIAEHDFKTIFYSFQFRNQNGQHQTNATSKLDDAYKVLGVTVESSENEVKTAYRKLAKLHHPDKVSHLGEKVTAAAQEKFQAIQDSYETVKSSLN